MRTSKFFKFVCYALIIATLVNGFIAPTAMAYATSPITDQGFTSSVFNAARVNDQATSMDTDNESFIEIRDKRTEYIKYYQLDSKRFEAVSFGLPVHYLEDGEYKQIDNSLELFTTKDGKEKYVNKANSFRVELATAISNDWTASISKDQYKISWSIIGVSNELLAASASEAPTLEPTLAPTIEPSPTPTLEPTMEPSAEPTMLPIPEETAGSDIEAALAEEAAVAGAEATATPDVTTEPEEAPVEETTPAPTAEPKATLSSEPSLAPSLEPTPESTLTPSLDKLMQFGTALAPSVASAKEALTKDAWKELSKGEQRRTVPNLASDVVYNNVLPGVDLQYIVISDRIKENMILNKPAKVAQITQKLQADGLALEKEADGTITAIAEDTQEPVFKMQAPYMMDKEGIGCNISFDLSEADGLYYLTYNLDQDWLATAKYPVTIDPTVTTSLAPADINDTRICSNLPNSNNANSYIMCTGYGSSSGINYSLVQFNNLPELGPSSMITKATYSVKRASSSSANSTVTVHEIKKSWTPAAVTWNSISNMSEFFDSTIEDYNVVDTVAGKTWKWDITRIAKSWYSGGTNYGILLKDISDSGGYKEWYTTNAEYGVVPSVTFEYTDFAGIEGYWDYASSGIGRGGSANVNLYNGNMIYTHSDLAMNGSRMPVAVDHVFNSTFRNENDEKLLYGNGWRTNFDQRVKSEKIGDKDYYRYTDEDGTAHYFALTDGEWKAEDGIDLKLTVGGDNTVTIKDKTDNKMVFQEVVIPDPENPDTRTFFLNYIEDNNGNRQTIGYDSENRINQITDGAGRVVLFVRDENGYLEAIKQPVDETNYRSIEYSYENGRLTGIRYPDDNTTTLSYDDDGNLASATNFDGKKVTIAYQDAAPYRVIEVEESNGDTLGGKLSFSYGYNRTEITDVEGRKAQYQFNDFGNTVCTIAPDGSAQYTRFGTLKGDGSVSDINKITLSSKTQKFGGNALLNHNMESSANWTINSYNGSTGSQGYATDQKYYGAKSAKLTKTNTTGFAAAIQTVTLEKGKTYTVSGYMKTSAVSGTFGAYIRALYYTETGSQVFLDSPAVIGTNDWGRYSVTFTVPENATSPNVSIYLLLKESTGTVWFDCVQLEEGNVINRYNLVENADFSSYSGNTPTFWTRSNLATSDTIDTSVDSMKQSYMSAARFKINGDCKPSTAKTVSQTVYISGNANDSLVLGGWAKGTSVSLTRDSAKLFGLTAEFKYTDGTSDNFLVSFNEDSYIWQYACGAIVAKKAFNSVIIRPHYSGEANTAWFDGIQLFREEFGQTYSYDADGNLVSAKDLESKNEQFTYTNNDLTKYVTPDLREYTYTYDAKHNLKTAVSPSGLTYAYDYDAYGNQTESKLGNDTEYIRSTTSYTVDGNYVDTMTDSFGKTVDYDFDSYKGTLSQVTDPDGKTVQYSYDDELDRQTGVGMSDAGKTMSNSYDYSGDYLTSVSHSSPNGGSVSYSLDYNDFGWRTETKVGSQSLATYTLKDRTGRLESIAYGNGQQTDYSYDAYDRLKKISHDSVDLYAYEYDNAGNIGYQKDLVNDKQYWYEYDSMLRLGKITSKDATGTINWTKYGFDNKNNLTSFKEKISSTEYTTIYTYDNEDRLKTAAFGSSSTNISYDAVLGRVMDYARKVSGNTVFNTSYTYAPGDGATSTASARVSALTNGSETLNYVYDDKGFITSISNGSNGSQYRYDAFGQLIRENYNCDGLSYTMLYTYDVGGNITSKSKHAYVAGDGDAGSPIETIDYEYTDANWKDKLTSFNGHTITYDEIGNPLNDGQWTYEWSQGRKLKQMMDGTTTVSYKYNDQGIRTEKTVNGITTKYNISGDMVTWEKTGTGSPIYYLYDANGDLWGLNHNGNIYFYVRNAQNDIIKIVDGSGAVVVTYSYDAWGNILDIAGTLASTLGQDNPFRYRGYYYDTETGLFAVGSRYYDPEIGRFINADGYVQTPNGDLTSTNMFVYCGNNPVHRYDPTGESFLAILGGIALWKIGVAIIAAVTAAVVASTIAKNPPLFPPISLPKIEAKPKAEAKDKAKDIAPALPKDTVIYRWPPIGKLSGGASAQNLTPSLRDTRSTNSGLSFSTIPKPGSAMTTIGALNATGVVYAVQDGLTHVSVYPVGATINDWYIAGPESIWTTAVKSVCIPWDGN